MSLVSERRSTLNPNAPLFIPAALRRVEDFSPEWWELVKTSSWFHDYWLSQQQGGYGFDGNVSGDCDIVDMLPDSIDTDEDLLSMEAQYEQFLHSSSMETANNTYGSLAYKQIPSNGMETEAEALIRSLNLSKSTSMQQVGLERAKYPEKPVRSFSPKIHSQRIQQPR